MEKDNETKEKILLKADEMFQKFGFSKVTMDEIAQSLGMSKKTVYKFFPKKEALIMAVFENIKCFISDYIDNLIKNEEMDFVDKLKDLMTFIGSQTSRMSGPLLTDLQKNMPKLWIEIQEYRKKHAHEQFRRFLEQGISKGIFRSDIDKQLLVLIYTNAIQGIITPDILSQIPFSANQVFETIITIIFEGILTDEGRKKCCKQSTNVN